MYVVLDSCGILVRGNFPSYKDAFNWKDIFGTNKYKVEQWK